LFTQCLQFSGFNNTTIVTLNQDLLANTDLGNLTTVEELTQDPGFQEFLSVSILGTLFSFSGFFFPFY